MPYIAGNMNLDRQLEILEIGCGDGGNLLPFAKSGHLVTGVDISTNRIKDATSFFKKSVPTENLYVPTYLKRNLTSISI